MKPIKKLAFTLIELLVVISIIGILAALAIPAVAGALVKGQMTGTLNNARQLQLATFNVDLENQAAGVRGSFPGTNNPDIKTVAQWIDELLNAKVLTTNDLVKMLSAPGVPVSPTTMTAENIALTIYGVDELNESSAIFITTRNWDAGKPEDFPANPTPYGDKGAIVMRKGGDGQVFQARFITNSTNTGLLTNQPAKIN